MLTWPELRSHVNHLPPGAALWRSQGRKDFDELFHEWAFTFIQFMGGKEVQTPTLYEQSAKTANPNRLVTRDPDEIHAWLTKHGVA